MTQRTITQWQKIAKSEALVFFFFFFQLFNTPKVGAGAEVVNINDTPNSHLKSQELPSPSVNDSGRHGDGADGVWRGSDGGDWEQWACWWLLKVRQKHMLLVSK